MPRRRYLLTLTILAFAFVGTFFLALTFGAVRISPKTFLQLLPAVLSDAGWNTSVTILFKLRLPRALIAAAVGSSLAVSGAGFQGFFRNPLADPYVIGASSGAALGAALAIVAGITNFGPFSFISLCAFVGALVTTFLAFLISRTVGDPPPAAALLLAGTALSSLFSAVLSLVLVLKDRDMHRVYYWLLGSFGGASWTGFFSAIPIMVVGCLIVFFASRPLDLLASGEDAAQSLGLDIKRARFVVAAGSSLAAAAAVSSAGILGFVGLVAPHAARFVVGPSHRKLIPASAFTGALLVLLADLVARTVVAPLELPIGVVTSAVGAPFFLYLLARRGRSLGVTR